MSECALLPERFILMCRGADIFSFLQGAVTCDIAPAQKRGMSVYGYLLTPQGKAIADIHIIPDRDDIMLDCGGAELATIVGILRLAALGRNVVITVREDLSLFALFGSDAGSVPLPEKTQEEALNYIMEYSGPGTVDRLSDALIFSDSRDCRLGYRIITEQKHVYAVAKSAGASFSDNADYYHVGRIYCGVPDAAHDIPPSGMFPLDVGAERCGAVSIRKGCYIGQEVVSRMYHKGKRRKQLVLATLSAGSTFSDSERFSPLKNTEGAKVGMLLSLSGNAALALILSEHMVNTLSLTVYSIRENDIKDAVKLSSINF